MWWLDFVVLILASDALATAWFYGDIFGNTQMKLLEKKGFFPNLFTCVMCLSYYIPLAIIILIFLPAYFMPGVVGDLLRLPVYAFAATDVVHFLQQVRPIGELKEEANDTTGSVKTDK